MTVAQDYSERHLEGYILANDNQINLANLEEVKRFLSNLGEPSTAFSTDQAIVWRGVPGLRVMSLLRGFTFPSAHADLGPISGGTSLFIDYVSDRVQDEMAQWEVAVPHPAGGEPGEEIVPGCRFAFRKRESGDVVEGGFRVTGGRNRVADPKDAQGGLTEDQLADGFAEREREGGLRGDKAFCAQRTRPLLLIHIFTTGNAPPEKNLSGPVVSLGFCLPSTSKASTARTYQVNAVYRRQIEQEANSETEDDEVMLEED